MICKIADLLIKLYPQYKDKLLSFECPWSKAKMITAGHRTNYRQLECGYYINCNHTALHACWVIQDLLDQFFIEKRTVNFLIHRPSSAEPNHVKEYIEKRFKKNFSFYIQNLYKKNEEYGQKVINLIEKYLNPLLKKISKSYTNFFLFDDYAILYNYIKKTRELVNHYYFQNEKARKSLNNCLDYLLEVYKEN